MARSRNAPRSLWTGSISFGLVNVPVRVFSAVHEHKLQFHLVHEQDDGPIGYDKVCKLEDKPYALLVRAMTDSQLAGIGKFVMRNRQYLGCLRVRDRTLILEQLHFADEVDPPSGVLPERLP